MKLTIAVITMNRARQLKEALASCLACELPNETEFVMISNGSTDNTEDVVRELFDKSSYSHYYEKLPENIGAGRGRNYAFSKSKGEYVYFLDDDAYIDVQNDNQFFIKAIDILDAHTNVMSLTTQIYDTILKGNRLVESSKNIIAPGLYGCFMLSGGSVFIRKSFFDNKDLFFPIPYGYEELLPSFRISDAGKINAYCPNLYVVHNPAFDKWSNNPEMNILSTAAIYAIKSLCYPLMAQPFLKLAFWRRRKLFLKDNEQENKAKQLAKAIKSTYSIEERIKLSTVIQLLIKFGLTAL